MPPGLGSSILGATPEDDIRLSELRRSGPEGRPATPSQPPAQPTDAFAGMSVLERIGLALGGVGAGLQGRLPEFQRSLVERQIGLAQQQRQERLDKLQGFGTFLNALKVVDDLNLSEDQVNTLAPALAELSKDFGLDLGEGLFKVGASSPGLFKLLAKRYPEFLQLPEAEQRNIERELKKNPKSLLSLLGGAEDRPKADFERVGLELFGKSTGFTAEEAGKINTEIQKRRVEVSAATGAEAVKTKAGKELAELEPILNIVESVKSFANQIITAKTGPEAIAQGARLHAGVISRTNAPAAAYQEGRQAFLGVLARALGGERGVLTDRDIKRVDGILPGFFDTEEIKRIKLGLLDNAVETAMNAKRKLAEGKSSPEQARAEVTARIDQLMKNLPESSSGFASADEVRKAFKRGQITRQQTEAILKGQFGFSD